MLSRFPPVELVLLAACVIGWVVRLVVIDHPQWDRYQQGKRIELAYNELVGVVQSGPLARAEDYAAIDVSETPEEFRRAFEAYRTAAVTMHEETDGTTSSNEVASARTRATAAFKELKRIARTYGVKPVARRRDGPDEDSDSDGG